MGNGFKNNTIYEGDFPLPLGAKPLLWYRLNYSAILQLEY